MCLREICAHVCGHRDINVYLIHAPISYVHTGPGMEQLIIRMNNTSVHILSRGTEYIVVTNWQLRRKIILIKNESSSFTSQCIVHLSWNLTTMIKLLGI
jgi:hypothetical protein